MSCTATADHSARCRVAHALQTSNLRVPFLANPLDPDGARHMAALTIMWRVQPSRSRARQVDGSREKVHAESPRVQMSKMTVLWLWGGMPRVQHAANPIQCNMYPRYQPCPLLTPSLQLSTVHPPYHCALSEANMASSASDLPFSSCATNLAHLAFQISGSCT